jgi:hypothetical protein
MEKSQATDAEPGKSVARPQANERRFGNRIPTGSQYESIHPAITCRTLALRTQYQSISTAGPNLIKSNPKRPVGFFSAPPRIQTMLLDPTRMNSEFWFDSVSFGSGSNRIYDKQCIKS